MNHSLVRNIFTGAVAASCFMLSATTAYAEKASGYLYTSLNGESTNKVVAFERYSDGSLGNQKTY